MPIFARFLTFYSEQYDESYVFKNVVFRSIYSIANLACLWAIIWYCWSWSCENKKESRKAKNEYMNSDVGDVM